MMRTCGYLQSTSISILTFRFHHKISSPSIMRIPLKCFFLITISIAGIWANSESKRLYDDLMSSYNSLIRPVGNNTDRLTIKMGLKLSQLIDLNLKDQIMATNVWVEQEWNDYNLRWDPAEYGGVDVLYIPAEQIWLPDLVLYNSFDGNYAITTMIKAVVHYTGKVVWNPPAIFRSICQIDITHFPSDKQVCTMKFGVWTYDFDKVDLRHQLEVPHTPVVDVGIDLSAFYPSVEWDIMAVPARRNVIKYSCCSEIYPDITFNITLRRKTLFYSVNLIIPVIGISSLAFLVFYLPSNCGEKVNLVINILLSLCFFLLVLLEMIPSTSIAMPLIGTYITFCLFMISLSVVVAIAVLNVHYRNPSTHTMAPWVRKVFIQTLPKLLLMRPPQYKLDTEKENGKKKEKEDQEQEKRFTDITGQQEEEQMPVPDMDFMTSEIPLPEPLPAPTYPKSLEKALENATFIAQHIDNLQEFRAIGEEWQYVAMVLDRLFLWIFWFIFVIGTSAFFLQSPILYDSDEPIDVLYSKVARSQSDSLSLEHLP